jgi:hypothetical protein|eukprot:SAG25_NODE_1342_length_3256_cov_1.553057_2_plen_74_part_00
MFEAQLPELSTDEDLAYMRSMFLLQVCPQSRALLVSTVLVWDPTSSLIAGTAAVCRCVMSCYMYACVRACVRA